MEGRIAGIVTSTDIVEMVDDAMGDDYAKLAGLTSEDDLKEKTFVSIKKDCHGLLFFYSLEWQYPLLWECLNR